MNSPNSNPEHVEVAAAKRTGLWHRAERVAVIDKVADRMLVVVKAMPDVVAPPELPIWDQRLLKLADFLDTLPRANLRMTSFGRECMTSACAIGHCPRVFPESWYWPENRPPTLRHPKTRLFDSFDAAKEFFGLTWSGGCHHLFDSTSYHAAVSPIMVADRIREFVASRNGGGK